MAQKTTAKKTSSTAKKSPTKSAAKQTAGSAQKPEEEKNQEQNQVLPEIKIKIQRLTNYESSKIKGIASATVGGAFAVHGLKIIEGQKGFFVQMPNFKAANGEYRDIFHAITADARKALDNSVLTAYGLKLAEIEAENAQKSAAQEHSGSEQNNDPEISI